jgi:uroporphyrinogen-III synthase
LKVKNILVSQPKPVDFEKSPYGQLAKKYNLVIDFNKFFRIDAVAAKDFRKDRVNILDFSAIILPSRNAVDHFFRMCQEMRVDIPDTMKYFCISESTAYYLQKYIQYRKRKIFYGKQTLNELTEVIRKHKTEKYLLPCSDVHKQEMTTSLDQYKINYKKAVFYKTVASDLSEVDLNNYDMLVFFSPAGVDSLFHNVPDFKQGEMNIAAFGASTAKAVEERGLTLNVMAPTPTCPSMTMAIDEYLDKMEKESRKKK